MKDHVPTWVWPVFVALLVTALPAHAEELTGTAQIVGSGYNSKVILDGAASPSPHVCRSDTSKRLSRLTGMTVKVQGEWKTKKDGAKDCFDAVEFTVLKTSSGRDAIVGVLSQEKGHYQVSDDSGKVVKLSDLSSGLKKLEGKKVILDVNLINTPAGLEASYKVITYAEMP
jgi:hypothetical protein